MKKIIFISLLFTQLAACTAEVGSDEWCDNIKDKPKGDITANEAKEYTKQCIFK